MLKYISIIFINLCLFSYSYAQTEDTDQNLLPSNLEMHTISAHSRGAEENLKHEQYCNSIGGIDITDKSDVKIAKNTKDAVFCQITDINKYMLATNDSSVLTKNDMPTVQAIVRSGAFSPGEYFVSGIGIFDEVHSECSVGVGVSEDKCFAMTEYAIDGGINVQLFAMIGCEDPRHNISLETRATACAYGGLCRDAYGTVTLL